MNQTRTKTRAPQVLELTAVEVENDEPIFDEALPGPDPSVPHAQHSFKWLALFGSAFAGLIVLGLTLWAEGLVRALLERQPLLGWLAVALVVLAALGLAGFVAKEVRAILRLQALDSLRQSLQTAYDQEDAPAARAALDKLVHVYHGHPRTAHGRAGFARQRSGVLDAQDLILIAEENLMAQLDNDAVRLVSAAARRVSLVTALSPRALVDVTMVAFQCISLTRQIAQLYGARPGLLGGLRLARHMLGHLAITGGMAATEGLVSQVLGHSLAARLSARLGEGVINGLLTARVGIAAIAVTRPMPYLASKGPTLSEVTRGIASLGSQKDLGKASPSNDGRPTRTER